jgi:cob(I)alamin adenosyltransferase
MPFKFNLQRYTMVRAGDCPPVIAKYLNRLSDFLYTAGLCTLNQVDP